MITIPHSRPEITGDDIRAVVAALEQRRLGQGPEVARLEKALAAGHPNAEAIVASSGTAALYLALVALGIKQGDKVIIPSYTCNSLFSAVSFARAEAVCADCGEGTINIDKSSVAAALSPSVKAVIAPHTCGYAADIAAISKLGLPVIEDCAQAIGGNYPDGSAIGDKGIISVFSFYATKLVPGGEGGACLTRDRELAERIRQLRDCDKRVPDPRAFNFKMTDISAALALRKLEELPKAIERRVQIAEVYDKAFKERSFRIAAKSHQTVAFRYLANAGETGATEFLRRSGDAGIICERPVWRPLHETIGGACPRAGAFGQSLVSVPLYPGLTDEEIETICSTLPALLGQSAKGEEASGKGQELNRGRKTPII